MESVRKYRFTLYSPFLNNVSDGIALFDFIGTFFVAYIIYKLFGFKINKKVYYSLVIPFAILIHKIFGINTFLNKQIFSEDVNVYKLLLFISVVFPYVWLSY